MTYRTVIKERFEHDDYSYQKCSRDLCTSLTCVCVYYIHVDHLHWSLVLEFPHAILRQLDNF